MYKIVSHTYFSMVSGLNPFGFEAITKTWDARYIMRFDTMAIFVTSRPKIIKYITCFHTKNLSREYLFFHIVKIVPFGFKIIEYIFGKFV